MNTPSPIIYSDGPPPGFMPAGLPKNADEDAYRDARREQWANDYTRGKDDREY